jgi:arylsulfatase A-like enzyme
MSDTRTVRRTVLRGLAAGTLATAAAPALSATPGAEATTGPPAPPRRRTRHNVVVVSVDDLGWDELGCYGNTFNETPRIDALAARGVRFTQAYAAAPLCSPTRAALVTGRYPARTGITDFLRPEDAVSDAFLDPRIPTVPDFLGPLGYTTGLVGKWHLTETYSGAYADRPGNPYAHGFDDVRVSEERYIADGDYVHPYFFAPSVEARTPGERLTDRLAQEAADFVADHADEPFFLHLSNYAVHTRLDPRPDLLAKYQAKPGAGEPGQRPDLAAMLEEVDTQVGAVVDALHEHRIADRTLVVVISDNGGANRPANAPLRGGKGELYEGGIRVPMIATWADGRQRDGRLDDTPVSTVDLLPTAIELAGGRPQRSRGRRHLDGISLAPLLAGRHGRPERREALFWVYPHHIGQTHPHAAVRSGDLKLVRHLRDGRQELYDLARDEAETTDLAAARTRDLRRLSRLLDEHLRDVDLLPPAPTEEAYPRAEAAIDLSEVDVLPVPAGGPGATTAVVGDTIEVTAGPLAHVVLRSRVAPTSDEVAAVLELGGFSDATTQQTAFVGLAVDAGTYLLMRYRHDLRRVGWDLRVDGTLRDGGAEPLTTLDGSVDLSAPGSRLGFTLRGSTAAAYADQGGGAGWEFLFRLDTAGAFDLRDRALRESTRYAASARVARTTTTLGPLTAARRR